MALRADVTSVATLRITTAHHLFDRFLHVGSLVGRYLFPPITPPPFPVVDEDLAETVATIRRGRMKQQNSRRSIGGDGQHSLASVNETAIITNRIFGLLSMVHSRLERLSEDSPAVPCDLKIWEEKEWR